MPDTPSITVELSDGTKLTDTAASLEDINDLLVDFETFIHPINLSGAPEPIRDLLAQSKLTAIETQTLMDHFILPRTTLVDYILASGRSPHFPDGGELHVLDATHGYSYPQLWSVQAEIDYRRFDRFHTNTDDDGTGVDEVCQLLCGGEFVVQRRSADEREAKIAIACSTPDFGWVVAYNGATPHVGSLSSAKPGTKVLVQVFGPPRFEMRYVE